MFSKIARYGTILRYLFFSSLFTLLQAKQAFAQRDEEEEGPKSYVLVYIIMIAVVGVTLGLMLRMGKRTIDFRQDEIKE